VFGVARRAPDLADVVTDERHNRVIAQPPLARAVVIDEITNPKLARMHAQSLENAGWDEDVAGRSILQEASTPVLAARSDRRTQVSNPSPVRPRNEGQRPPATAIRGSRCQRQAGNEKRRLRAS
jgi:hypothetical protein